tara:strand:+ start:325 stop:513 length:189 start_codon:yes stop_codon:yes gene_type:complete
MVSKEILEPLVSREQLVLLVLEDNRVRLALQVHRVSMVMMGLLERLDLEVSKGLQGLQGLRV